MAVPVLLAFEPDHESLSFLQTQLVQRYSADYRVECLEDPDLALRRLTELADIGEDVALVLAGKSKTRAGWLLEHGGPNAPFLIGGLGALALGCAVTRILPPPVSPHVAASRTPPGSAPAGTLGESQMERGGAALPFGDTR